MVTIRTTHMVAVAQKEPSGEATKRALDMRKRVSGIMSVYAQDLSSKCTGSRREVHGQIRALGLQVRVEWLSVTVRLCGTMQELRR